MYNPLRTLVLTIACALWSVTSTAQWVSIPDTNFGTWLYTNGYGGCMLGDNTLGWQMDTNCTTVMFSSVLYPQFASISDLTGVEYFDNLQTLGCNNNQLSSLPPLPATLTTLYCDNNQLTSLPDLPPSLTLLNCAYNQLTALPALPASLIDLVCDNNSITALPALPNQLYGLYCNSNVLTALPVLPASLNTIECTDNLLSALPSLPATLTTLACNLNNLTALPVLPGGLTLLDCSYNQITALPALPGTIIRLQVQHNQLTSIPPLPDYLYIFYCNDNTALTCLPQLKVVDELDFDNTAVTCLPNYPVGSGVSQPPLASLPLCDIFNTNGCSVFWNITGTVYNDADSNCVNNTGEGKLNNLKVNLYQNGVQQQQVYTNAYGTYSFNTGSFTTYTYRLDTANLPFIITCPDTGYYTSVISAADSMDFGNDFGLKCKPGFDVAAWGIEGGFIPANIRPFYVSAGDASNFYNAHCAAGISGSVTLTYTGPVQFVSAAAGALTPAVSGNSLTWNIADFGNVSFTDFSILLHTDTTAQIGQQVCFTLTVNPTAGDYNPANNVLTRCLNVVASYDPNDKTAYPAGNIDTAQKELTYTIRFQNTGTAEAQHIYITDTLDTDVDASTFQLLAYSHQPMVQLKENAVRFNFPNINLPDSNTNEPLSHGYVQYKVKLKPNLPIGTVINNTAYIYFDFNAPVVTNTTTNTISLISSIQVASHEPLAFRMFPNPSNGSVTISVDESLIGSTATISDITGRVVAVVPLTTQYSTLSTLAFGSGVYFVTLGNSTQKLIITK